METLDVGRVARPPAPDTPRVAPGPAFGRGASPPGLRRPCRLTREWRLRRDMRRLADHDDHMLRDIGIARADIEGAVRRGHD